MLVSNGNAMLFSISDLRSVWLSLSLSNQIFFLFFSAVSIYTVFLCLFVLFHIHSLEKRRHAGNANDVASSPEVFTRRLANLRQLHLFSLYLFGFCIVLNIPGAFATLDSSKALPYLQYIAALRFLLYFDALIFLGFLLLHSLQWVTYARVDQFVHHRD
jgi:hypothetical protein